MNKASFFVDRLKVHIDFIGLNRFRLTTPYRQREFEVGKHRFINAETLEPIKFLSENIDFYLRVGEHTGMDPQKDYIKYTFKAKISDNGGVVGETAHLKPLTVEFKMVRKK